MAGTSLDARTIPPRPLKYQFQAERPGFSWEYVEQGPAVWRVRIGKSA